MGVPRWSRGIAKRPQPQQGNAHAKRRRSTIAGWLSKNWRFSWPPRNSKRYYTNLSGNDTEIMLHIVKNGPEMPSAHLNKPTGQQDEVLSESENNDNQKHPKAAHFCLLPPRQSAFDFNKFSIYTVSVNDTISIHNILLDWFGPFLWLIFQRMI